MSLTLQSLPSSYRALVVGATGTIGRAVTGLLANDPRCGACFAASRSGTDVADVPGLSLDLDAPETLEDAVAAASANGPLHLVFVATGALHGQGAMDPERTWRHVSADGLLDAYKVNAVLPALVARAALPRLARGTRDAPQKAVFAALSARVGSISDNRLGGWHGYRASKAALNQILKTCAIELARKAPAAVCIGLHPGTVDSGLSRPYQRNVPDGKLFTADYSARCLLGVIDQIDARQSGRIFDWAGEEILP